MAQRRALDFDFNPYYLSDPLWDGMGCADVVLKSKNLGSFTGHVRLRWVQETVNPLKVCPASSSFLLSIIFISLFS